MFTNRHVLQRQSTCKNWKRGPLQASGVEIIAADLPALFKHDPNPGESLMRKVMAAVQEFERDMVVLRLHHGLQQQRKMAQDAIKSGRAGVRRTQHGSVKVNGSLTILERIRPSARALQALRQVRQKTVAKKISWRLGLPACCQGT